MSYLGRPEARRRDRMAPRVTHSCATLPGTVLDLIVVDQGHHVRLYSVPILLVRVRPCDPGVMCASFMPQVRPTPIRWHETVEDIVAPAVPRHLPLCTAGAQARPPEDCGSSDGYTRLLEELASPAHLKHEAMMVWARSFEPEDGRVLTSKVAGAGSVVCALSRLGDLQFIIVQIEPETLGPQRTLRALLRGWASRRSSPPIASCGSVQMRNGKDRRIPECVAYSRVRLPGSVLDLAVVDHVAVKLLVFRNPDVVSNLSAGLKRSQRQELLDVHGS